MPPLGIDSVLRAVLNTNVHIAAQLSKNPNSPTVELIRRWRNGESILLCSSQLYDELDEKLKDKPVSDGRRQQLLAQIQVDAEWVSVSSSDIMPVIHADPDDDQVIACAVVGKATYIVTYDPHFEQLGGEHQGVKIVKPLEFLEVLRARER